MKIKGSGKFKKEKILCFAGASVLEVGCGEGKYTGFAAMCGKESFGIDINLAAIVRARSIFGEKFILADAHNLPFADKSFDTICLWDVLEHVENDSVVLREAVRVARKNLLISVPKEDNFADSSAGITFRTYSDLSHRRYYSRELLEKLLQGIGRFQIEEFDRIRPALAYTRAGFPRFILSFLDRLLWLLSPRKSSLSRNLFALVDISKNPMCGE